MTKSAKIITILVLIVAVAMGVLYGKRLLSVHQGIEPPPVLAALHLEKTPKPAPDVGFADAGGVRHALSTFRGRYVLLNLWATWCAPCVAELPALARLQAFAPGLKVLAINTDRGQVDAGAFLKSHKVRLPVFRDSDVTMLRSFQAYGLPVTVLIDPTGRIVAKAEGPADWDNPEAVAYFKRITGS